MFEKPDDFFDHTDLLDFSATVPHKIGDLRAKLGEEDMLKQRKRQGCLPF